MLIQFFTLIFTGFSPSVFRILTIILPIVLPFIFIILYLDFRLRYAQLRFMNKMKKVLFEIKLPKEITKSPASMEIFFSYFAQNGPKAYTEALLDGKVKPWFTCELVSDQGEIHIYIWTWEKYKNLLEAQLYAQYPNLEIYVADDYVNKFEYDQEKFSYFGAQHGLSKPDPYPIKTYIDYGLDADQKDEYKIDPLNSLFEFLGSMKKDEHVWVQILIQKHGEEKRFLNGRWLGKKDWKDDIKSVVKKLKIATIPDFMKTDKDDKFSKIPSPTKVQTETIAAVERSANKIPFDCMIRTIYFAKKESFNPLNLSSLMASLRSFNSSNLNGFSPANVTDTDDYQKDLIRLFPWLFNNYYKSDVEDFKKNVFNAYKLRSYFQLPYRKLGPSKSFILNTEELATLFHFPSHIVSQTPTLSRVPSKKYEAPSNLPI
ncbi:MAG: hypothetical protein WCC74_02720 [Minisyncoccia bacterium]